MHELFNWVLDFIGVHNGENRFSTEMYNFWSGFGGNISVLALGGTVFGIYRHNLKRLAHLNPVHLHRRSRGSSSQDEPPEAPDAD